MRLIDADALAEQVDNLCADWNENWIGNDNQSFILHGDVSDIISDAPTIEAEPVRHGRWVNIMSGIIDTIGDCANCGQEAVWRTRNKPYAVCPNCGAKMDVTDTNVENKGGDPK